MHETRNFILCLLLIAAVVWTILAWVFLGPEASMLQLQRIVAPLAVLGLGGMLAYALKFEDRLPNNLRQVVGDLYYEADGVSFMPIVRVGGSGDQAELCVYYQNRYEGPAEVLVHLRPTAEAFVVREGMQDISIAFRCNGGDFGMIHQPIAVPIHLQGDVITLELAAASFYPRSHGACWRRKPGMPCGTMPVDWSGSALKSGVHEGSREMKLTRPVVIHLSMPSAVRSDLGPQAAWRQEQLVAGQAA